MILMNLADVFMKFLGSTGFSTLELGQVVMLIISFVLLYLAIYKGFEPLLLVPIAFGILISGS